MLFYIYRQNDRKKALANANQSVVINNDSECCANECNCSDENVVCDCADEKTEECSCSDGKCCK